MKINIYIIDPTDGREIPADAWISQSRNKAIRGAWLVIRADGFPAFIISKNDLYPKCQTSDFFDSAKTASHIGCRLGNENEWQIVHEAKMHNNLDRIIATIEGDVVGCKYTYTENGNVVRSYTRDGYMETFDRSKLIGRTEIFARGFKSMIR